MEGKGKEEGKGRRGVRGEGKGGEASRFLDLPTWQPYVYYVSVCDGVSRCCWWEDVISQSLADQFSG